MSDLPARYEDKRLLGAGGMGSVRLVFDRERGEEVALKTLAPAAGADVEEARFLFKQEFWAMASLSHPGLVAAYDYGELPGGSAYFTMELVPGADLDPAAPASEERVRAWLPSVASALAYLHARGYVHGDLKPENIRASEHGAKLMDLGLLGRVGRAPTAVRGSLLYLAPEVARQAPVDGRADLYALGAVLYHVLAGRPPFEADDAIGLLRAHLDLPPVPLRQHAPGVSRELEAAVMRLLAKDPAERFAAAPELLEALGLHVEGTQTQGLLGSPLLGRDDVRGELGRLLRASGGGTRWVVGGAGSGKSRLLAETRAEAQLEGLPTFYAQGLGADATAYGALRPWLLALAARPSDARERVAPVLARLLPEVGAIVGQPALVPAAPLEGVQERLRLHGAILDLARAAAPSAVWLLDDADQLDAASQELLAFLQAQGAGTPWRWILAAQGSGEGTRTLPLAPLDEATTLAVARALLGQDELSAEVTERLPLLTGGLPGAIEAVVGHWVRSGALRREGGRWQAAPGKTFEVPGGWQVALDARFTELSEAAQRVGRTAALLGAQAELPWLADLVELDQAAFFAALAELESAEVLTREESQFRFLRPAQATALAASWSEADARRLHTAAASWLAERMAAPTDPNAPLDAVRRVARHHLAGTTPLLGVPFVLATARRALAMYVAAGLEPLLKQALAVPAQPPQDRLRLLAALGTVYRFDGEVDEALALYENELIPGMRETESRDLAQQLVTLGVVYQMKGRYPKALEAFAEAINLADASGDGEAGIRARVFAGRVGYFAGETAAARTHLASAVRRAREAGLKAHLASALGLYGYVIATTDPPRPEEGLAALDESVTLNRSLGNLYELHEALNNKGNVFLAVGRLSDARSAFGECLLLCQRMGMANEALFAHLNLGAVLLELGQVGASLAEARKALEMARQQGRKFPEGYATALEGMALVYAGELTTGLERLERGLALAREIKNRYLELNVLVFRAEAQLFLGRFFEAETTLAKARETARATHNDEQNAKLDRLEVGLAVAVGAPDADARVAVFVERARGAGTAVPLAQALYLLGDRQRRQGQDPGEALAEAATLARDAGTVLLAAAIEELWGRALLGTDKAAALAHFMAGHALAVENGHRLLEILCQAGLGASDPHQRENRQEAPRRMEALMATLEPSERQDFLAYPERQGAMRVSQGDGAGYSADRLHHLTDLIATISSQPDLPAVMARALAAMVDIAGAERGFLLLYRGFEVTQQIFHGMREDESDLYSSSLAHQILWSGEPLFVEDAQGHAGFAGNASIQALALRSMVGVPLNDGNETIGVMLADSQRINARFSEEDLDLCMALGRQVAIAISNTRRLEQYKNGYEELAMLHRLAIATLGERTLDGFMGPIGAEAIKLCDADRALLLVGDALACCAAVAPDGTSLSTSAADISQSVSRWVYEQGEPLHLLDAQSDESFQGRKSIQALGLRTIYAVPVTHEGSRLGVLYLDNTRMGDANPQGLHALARIGELVGAYLARSGEPA